jgi:hypothetical protein
MEIAASAFGLLAMTNRRSNLAEIAASAFAS